MPFHPSNVFWMHPRPPRTACRLGSSLWQAVYGCIPFRDPHLICVDIVCVAAHEGDFFSESQLGVAVRQRAFSFLALGEHQLQASVAILEYHLVLAALGKQRRENKKAKRTGQHNGLSGERPVREWDARITEITKTEDRRVGDGKGHDERCRSGEHRATADSNPQHYRENHRYWHGRCPGSRWKGDNKRTGRTEGHERHRTLDLFAPGRRPAHRRREPYGQWGHRNDPKCGRCEPSAPNVQNVGCWFGDRYHR